MSRRPILVLKTGEALPLVKERRGDFERWIAEGLGDGPVVVVSVHEGEALPEVESIGGVVVTGSPAMVSDRHDWSEAAARWLAEIVEQDAVPVLGLCYGHQLLAHALGGEVGPNPRGREMGTVEIRVRAPGEPSAEGDWAALIEPSQFVGHMSHLESVLRPRPGRACSRRAISSRMRRCNTDHANGACSSIPSSTARSCSSTSRRGARCWSAKGAIPTR